eukprot:TRINITY_DN12202_c0_g1_i1.p1 TRINITY_DN12202_c0_g1~~TRINITY_DN12202_c0_g1_i1.p1  ORF type:complete len:545 (-),score=91.79 TRINITY_DN12202_c0_g1_i1:178-1704(-)
MSMAIRLKFLTAASFLSSSQAALGLGRGAALGNFPWGWSSEAAKEAKYFSQRQDHFDSDNKNTWQQAYYVNADFWSGSSSDAPVFLYVGGEGPMGPDHTVVDNFITDWLPKNKGILFAVEHRYYGCHNMSACPYDNKTSDHLRFLSSRQALADLAAFHSFATGTFGLRKDAKWVAVGGSYPGMLAGFLRAEYPEKFYSAISSSAPVHAILDMTVFQDTVTKAYAMNVEGIRGSPECSRLIAQGHEEVGKLLKTAQGRSRLASSFKLESADWLKDPTNQRTFAGCGVASFPAQSNYPACDSPACGISEICEIMTNSSSGKDALERLATLRQAQRGTGLQMVATCEMDWEMPGDIDRPEVNYWGYQTCAEFGFYQTCEKGTDCFYTKGLVSFRNPQHRPNDFCKEQFGISTEETTARIKRTVEYYQKKVAQSSRIIWASGDVDPWHGLGQLTSPGKDQPVIFPIRGASHCAWMRAAAKSDQESLVEARAKIYKQISTWLDSGSEATEVVV